MGIRTDSTRMRQPLLASDFIRIASGGFGEAENTFAHSMAWFRGKLYVGTTRTQTPNADADANVNLRGFVAAGLHTNTPHANQRAQIWRYDPETDQWTKSFESPLVSMPDGAALPRDIGYRNMFVYPPANSTDAEPTLYVSTISTLGSLLLRSSDGETFSPVSTEILPNKNAWSFRTLLPFGDKVLTTPLGKMGSEEVAPNMSNDPRILENTNPDNPNWRPVSESGFGDSNNLSIFEMISFNDWIYAGTFNPYSGFQIWKGRPNGTTYEWKNVITAGAFRGSANAAVASMRVFQDVLYVGTGVQGAGEDSAQRLGGAAPELIRIHKDDSWELVMGVARPTFEGYKYPLSGFGTGFDNAFTTVVWRMVEHDGWLYAGTLDWSSFLSFFLNKSGKSVRNRSKRWLEKLVQQQGGFDLWRSQDGIHWELVTCVGFGNPNNFGVRTLVSTSVGLFVGTVSASLTAHEDRHSTGCEVWLGRK